MGGKSDSGNAGKTTERMAKEFYDTTDPLRKGLISNYENFLGLQPDASAQRVPKYETRSVQNPDWYSGAWDSGENIPRMIQKKVRVGWEDTPMISSEPGGQSAYDVTRNPVFGTGRDMINRQYAVARQNALSNLPAGGGLTDMMTDIETSRAQSMGGLASQVSQDEYNKLYGLATGAPGQSMTVMSNLAGQQAAASAQEQAGKFGALGDLGMGAGMLFGGKPPKV